MKLESIRESINEVQVYLNELAISNPKLLQKIRDGRICADIVLDAVYELEKKLDKLKSLKASL